jgi:hypothetical protein
MGLFTKLFGAKARSNYEHPQLGAFTLVYRKGGRNLWSCTVKDILLTVQGSEDEPFEEHLAFLEQAEERLERLHPAITQRFVPEWEEAGKEPGFTDWKERFQVVGITVEDMSQGKPIWLVTFEALSEPFAHFNLHIEGEELKDFSIDT